MQGVIVYPEISYQVVGAAFQVFNSVGYGASEKHYQNLLAKVLEEIGIPFQKEQAVTLQYHDQPAGRYFLDFVVDNKIVVELKIRPQLGYTHVKQVMSYLKATGYKLAILIYFTRDGVKYRRILNVG